MTINPDNIHEIVTTVRNVQSHVQDMDVRIARTIDRDEWERMFREWTQWRLDVDKWRAEYTGQQAGRQAGYAIVLSLIGALVGVVAILLTIFK